MDKIIRVENFSYRYNGNAIPSLYQINFSASRGEVIAVIGANGSGKSTLCHALVGLIPHYFVGFHEGSVTVANQATNTVSVGELSQTIGLVFQNPFNQLSYTTETVREELAFGLGHRGMERDQMLSKIAQVAETTRITELLERNPLELSGGQVQRVALAAALIVEPEIIVLDECTTQLDPIGSQQIMETVKRLNKNGMTVIMVDHDMERVAELADRIIVLHQGQLVLQGTPQEVFSSADLGDYGLSIPDYYAITRNYLAAPAVLTEAEAISRLQEVLKNAD